MNLNDQQIITCPSCKGKGHVLEGMMMLHPIFWLIAPFERNDKDGITRQDCPQCSGKGSVRIRM